MTIYIVMGKTGEYSDRSEWPVVAYPSYSEAQNHVLLATEQARLIESKREHQYDYISDDEDNNDEKNPYDPKMKIDYNGTRYYVMEVDLLDSMILFDKSLGVHI
jgi:hypothetical protein